MPDADQQMTPQGALDHVHRMTDRVRAAARWHGWAWLAIAFLTPAFWIGTRDGGLARPQQFWVAIAFCAVGAVLAVWAQRRGVLGRRTARIDGPTTVAYVTATAAVAVVTMIWNPVLTPWYVALASIPSVPCLVAAWKILRG